MTQDQEAMKNDNQGTQNLSGETVSAHVEVSNNNSWLSTCYHQYEHSSSQTQKSVRARIARKHFREEVGLGLGFEGWVGVREAE